VLAFSQRAAARDIEKVLRSAIANAEANHNLTGDELIVSAAYVDEGPTIKRWRARARGRVARINKRTCHITVMVAGMPRASAAPSRRATAKAEQPDPTSVTATPPADEPKTTPRKRTPRKKKEATA
jgi:large subunit ribosomal protein L22